MLAQAGSHAHARAYLPEGTGANSRVFLTFSSKTSLDTISYHIFFSCYCYCSCSSCSSSSSSTTITSHRRRRPTRSRSSGARPSGARRRVRTRRRRAHPLNVTGQFAAVGTSSTRNNQKQSAGETPRAALERARDSAPDSACAREISREIPHAGAARHVRAGCVRVATAAALPHGEMGAMTRPSITGGSDIRPQCGIGA